MSAARGLLLEQVACEGSDHISREGRSGLHVLGVRGAYITKQPGKHACPDYYDRHTNRP
jgi:paraquat-inducible protein B